MELILGEVFPIEHVDFSANHDSLLECTYASTHYIISVEPPKEPILLSITPVG